MRNQPAQPLGVYVRRSLMKGAILGAFIGASAGGMALGGAFDVLEYDTAPGITRPAAEGSPADLVARHGCWSGEAPADMAGKMPGHVVATLPNGETRLGGSHLVNKALDQLFAGEDHGLIVRGFCR